MWMGKIGNKSAAFINHKHFHPGNRENLEKVWLAEEKHKAELKRQREMRERLADEIKMTELKRQLRLQEEQQYLQYLLAEKPPSRYEVTQPSHRIRNGASGLILTTEPTQSASADTSKDPPVHKVVVRSRYREDVFERGHSTVFGSFYDRETGSWGYRCCRILDRDARCTADPGKATPSRDSAADRNSRKRRSDEGAEGAQVPSSKHKRKADLSLTETLHQLKQMDALD